MITVLLTGLFDAAGFDNPAIPAEVLAGMFVGIVISCIVCYVQFSRRLKELTGDYEGQLHRAHVAEDRARELLSSVNSLKHAARSLELEHHAGGEHESHDSYWLAAVREALEELERT